MISSLEATASRDADPGSSGAWTDEMELRFQARLEAAVAEETSELRGELANAAAKLEAAERKVTTLTRRCICLRFDQALAADHVVLHQQAKQTELFAWKFTNDSDDTQWVLALMFVGSFAAFQKRWVSRCHAGGGAGR